MLLKPGRTLPYERTGIDKSGYNDRGGQAVPSPNERNPLVILGIRPTSAAIGTVLLLGSGTAAFADEKIEFFFVGRQHCGFSQRVVDTGVLPGLVENVRKEAQRRGAAFESICVNADTDPEAAETFIRLACGGFDRVVSTGEGLDTAEIRRYAYEPPSQDSMEFPPGAVGTPYVLILRRADGKLVANRWISAVIVTLANRLEGRDDGTPLPDNMMPPKPADMRGGVGAR